ncbi:MAG: type II 3-dehydroquinate dehydratase [Raoultibacter sp.]
MKEFLLLHGPNLDLLGTREPEVYGTLTLESLEDRLREYANTLGVRLTCRQSNHEGDLIEIIHTARLIYDGIIYNPGAHTHYAYALRDAIGATGLPVVEVHISDTQAREPFRARSVIAPVCVAQIRGKGFLGYTEALDILLDGAIERLGEGFDSAPCGGTIIAQVAASPDEGEGAGVVQPDAGSGSGVEGAAGGRDAEADAPPIDPQPRVAALQDLCAQQGFSAFYVRGLSNIKWLCAFDDVFDDEDAHALMVSAAGAVLHTDTRYAEACKQAARATPIAIDAAPATFWEFAAAELAQVVGAAGGADAAEAADAADAAEAATHTLAIEDSIALAEYRHLSTTFEAAGATPHFAETSNLILNLRAVKDEAEIARMKAAQAITDAAFTHIIGFIRPGMTERAIQIELEDFMVRQGARSLAFSSIVATGANGASPHAIPGQTRLEAGQCVVLDFGARALGYCSDMTRTVFLGAPQGVMARAWETLRRANETVEDMLRPGITGAEAHAAAEDVLAQGGFGGAMGHGLGHGVGIDIHEQPVLSPRNDKPLACGNVVTVEPGIYIPGQFGMRLEDFGVITHEGFEIFTQSTHETVIL